MPRSSIISSLTRRSAAVLLAHVSPYCATGATTTSTTTCARTDLWRVHGELRRWKKTTTWLAQRHSSKHKIRADRRCTAALGSHGHAGAVERARARAGVEEGDDAPVGSYTAHAQINGHTLSSTLRCRCAFFCSRIVYTGRQHFFCALSRSASRVGATVLDANMRRARPRNRLNIDHGQ